MTNERMPFRADLDALDYIASNRLTEEMDAEFDIDWDNWEPIDPVSAIGVVDQLKLEVGPEHQIFISFKALRFSQKMVHRMTFLSPTLTTLQRSLSFIQHGQKMLNLIAIIQEQ